MNSNSKDFNSRKIKDSCNSVKSIYQTEQSSLGKKKTGTLSESEN